MNKLNWLGVLLIDSILVYNQREQHIKYHLFSVSSFCAVAYCEKPKVSQPYSLYPTVPA